MRVQLFHGDGRSAVVVDDTVIEYERRIHRYESESDYRLITTELATYGAAGAQTLVDYLQAARRRRS